MDTTSLRSVLLRADATPARVQGAAKAMMKHYDKTTTIAVNEWRNALQTCSTQQLLPLVYIVNEVLQTSKRNRGNNFLEAFSPVLGSSMRYICERDKSIVEKVRRILKIWGDRRVFSGRFVGELLRNLETLRGTATDLSRPKTGGGEPPQSNSTAHQPTFPNINSGKTSSVVSGENSDMDDDQDDDDDGLSSPFANSGQSLLQVNVNMDKTTPISRKRPLPDQGNEDKLQDSAKKQQKSKQARKNIKSPTQPQRVKVYSTSTLLDLLKRTEDLSTDFQSAKGILAGIPSSHFSTDPDAVAELVGDELVKMHDDVRKSTKLLNSQRRIVHAIAKERKILEIDAVKFIPFLKDSLKQDDEELLFCDKLEAKIKKLAVVIKAARSIRDKKREEEEFMRKKIEEDEKRQRDEAERKRMLESAMNQKEEAPGMVYNPVTRQFQSIHDHTEDDWRN